MTSSHFLFKRRGFFSSLNFSHFLVELNELIKMNLFVKNLCSQFSLSFKSVNLHKKHK